MQMTLVRALLHKSLDDLFIYLKNKVQTFYAKVKARTFTTVTICSLDTLYSPLLIWLKDNNIEEDCRNYRYRTVFMEGKPKQVFGPALGKYNITYKGKPLAVSVQEDQVPMVNDNNENSKQTIESVTLTIKGDGSELKALLKELFSRHVTKAKSTLEVRSYDGRYWARSKDLPKKHHNGLILAEGKLEEIEKIVHTWQHSKEWYISRDIPYRLGLLFYGKPGTGKTSLVKHLARFTDYNIYVCMAAALSAENFIKALSEVPKKTIILIEDIDCLYQKRQKTQKNLVDFSSLLNGLDGLVAVEDVILIMTTNHLDDLDAALIRPGRIDEKIEISLCTSDQGQRLFNKFFPESTLELNLPSDVYTPAQLQEVFLRSANDAEVLINLANVNPEDHTHVKDEIVPMSDVEDETLGVLIKPTKPRSKSFWEKFDLRRLRNKMREDNNV